MTPQQPLLAGLRVIELATFVFGPGSTAVMADFGADVIKVEAPGLGDPFRHAHNSPPFMPLDFAYMWQQDNRNKRSIALDREARDAEYALYERAQLTLYNAKGQLLRGPTMLEQRRLVVNDPDNPVGEETESSIVRAEMREQLSIRLAQQLEYWSRLLDQDSVNAPAP